MLAFINNKIFQIFMRWKLGFTGYWSDENTAKSNLNRSNHCIYKKFIGDKKEEIGGVQLISTVSWKHTAFKGCLLGWTSWFLSHTICVATFFIGSQLSLLNMTGLGILAICISLWQLLGLSSKLETEELLELFRPDKEIATPGNLRRHVAIHRVEEASTRIRTNGFV